MAATTRATVASRSPWSQPWRASWKPACRYRRLAAHGDVLGAAGRAGGHGRPGGGRHGTAGLTPRQACFNCEGRLRNRAQRPVTHPQLKAPTSHNPFKSTTIKCRVHVRCSAVPIEAVVTDREEQPARQENGLLRPADNSTGS